MRSWEVNDDAWEAFQKAEDMCAGIQAAYEAGIQAATRHDRLNLPAKKVRESDA